jgi:hypothetical protein
MTYEEEISLQSYMIWQQEGCPIGDDLKHWLRAKAEIEAKRAAAHQQANYFR